MNSWLNLFWPHRVEAVLGSPKYYVCRSPRCGEYRYGSRFCWDVDGVSRVKVSSKVERVILETSASCSSESRSAGGGHVPKRLALGQ